jgi:hypothetical protein
MIVPGGVATLRRQLLDGITEDTWVEARTGPSSIVHERAHRPLCMNVHTIRCARSCTIWRQYQ